MSFHSLLSKAKTIGRRKHQKIITSLWVFIFVFFSSLFGFHYLLSKTKTRNHKRKRKREKRSNWTKLPRKSKEENNNNRQRPNQKKKNNNKEEGIGIVQYLQTEPKKKKKGNGLDKPMCKYTWVFSSFTYQISPTQFSFYFEEKIFCWIQGENTWTLPIFFLSLPPTKHLPKKFSFPFSFQNFPSHFLFKVFSW